MDASCATSMESISREARLDDAVAVVVAAVVVAAATTALVLLVVVAALLLVLLGAVGALVLLARLLLALGLLRLGLLRLVLLGRGLLVLALARLAALGSGRVCRGRGRGLGLRDGLGLVDDLARAAAAALGRLGSLVLIFCHVWESFVSGARGASRTLPYPQRRRTRGTRRAWAQNP